MNTIKFKKYNTKIIAHRGLSGLEAENTNAAFVAAGNRSYWGIETDIHKTLDGAFAVIHDDTAKRVTGCGLTVEESTIRELQCLTIKDTDGLKRCDLKIPTLDEYIRICKKYCKAAVLELKNKFEYNDIKKIVSIISELGYIENTVFISFVLENLVNLRKIAPNQKAQYLTNCYSDELLNILIENKLDLDIYHKKLTKKILKTLKKNGIEVNCWTCNTAEDAQELAKYGVDYITTNILE